MPRKRAVRTPASHPTACDRVGLLHGLSCHLTHFDIVEVLETPHTRESEVAGTLGYIAGLADDDAADERSYAVVIESLGQTVILRRSDRPMRSRPPRGATDLRTP